MTSYQDKDHDKKKADVTTKNPQVQEITKVTQEIYEKNVELVLRNHTLSALRKIYDIINNSLGVKETSQRLVDAIVQEIRLPVGFIALIDKKNHKLSLVAASTYIKKPGKEVLFIYRKYIKELHISLHNEENICIKAIKTKKKQVTNNLHGVVSPAVPKDAIMQVAEQLSVKTSIIYPILFGKVVLGIIMIGIDKEVDSLSRAEKDMLNELSDVAGIALERAQTYTDLKEANARLKKLDALKDEFVSIASHELRTPMTAIKSYLWMALNKGGPVGEPMKKYLEISYASTERLIHLVNDMLVVSRIDRNKIELKLEVFDVLEVMQMVYEELKISADEKKIVFTLDKKDKTQSSVRGDKIKIREVFQNIIGNALKFTPASGKIATKISSTEHHLRIAITDTGPGIPENEMNKLFQKFSKIDYSYANHVNQPGTGLGLYISKQIVSLHGGNIEVESSVGVGSTFTVVLPLFKENGGA